MTKLLDYFENHHAEVHGEAHLITSRWTERLLSNYSSHTLARMLSSPTAAVRRAAAWGLSFIGDESHLSNLGDLLRDSARAVRTSSDLARRAILQRTQSPWHRRTVCKVEQFMADGNYNSATVLASDLVDEAEKRSDVYLLRAWVRFSDGEIPSAIDDYKRTLAIDRFCYQACVALGQCMWHLQRDAAARECYCEAARIYPDWEPARAGLHLLAKG